MSVGHTDQLEAECRKRMAKVPAARGWDTQRERDAELAEVDLLLDLWLEATAET